MKKHSYTFNFNTFFFITFYCVIIFIFVVFTSKFLLKITDKRYYNFFNSLELNYDFVLIGNSRSVGLENYTNKKVLNLSYNELSYKTANLFVKTLKTKNIKNQKIFIEITALQEGPINCDLMIYDDLQFFDKSKFKNCKNYKFPFNILNLIKINSEIFQRIIIEEILNLKKIPKLTLSKEYCYNATIPYNKYYNNIKNLINLEKSINKINKEIKNVNYFISPFFKGYETSKNIENFLKSKNINIISFTNHIDKNIYNDCKYFWDSSHFNDKLVDQINDYLWQ